ncbi:MAG: hypothetical protein M3P47_06605, partial [Pseudomonadota bacterium]|nr:hypothetical protein [Pseudomonadota bacterium]
CTHGGKREGAGRKPKPPPKIGVHVAATDPKAFLLAVMNNADTDAGLRIDAAKALLPFMHTKPGEGKKETQSQKAQAASTGHFAPGNPPMIEVNSVSFETRRQSPQICGAQQLR